MFGFSFGEITLLLIVGIIVVGPKNLPTMMRTAGQWIGKLRRMSTDLRYQSGIDDLIRKEGLEREIQELRALARMNVVDSLMSPGIGAAAAPRAVPVQASSGAGPYPAKPADDFQRKEPLREREYPLIGCDALGALGDDAVIYAPEPAAPSADSAPHAEPTTASADEAAPPLPYPVFEGSSATPDPGSASQEAGSAARKDGSPLPPKDSAAPAPLLASEGPHGGSPA